MGCVDDRRALPDLVLRGAEGCRVVLRPTQYTYAAGAAFCVGLLNSGVRNDNTLGLLALERRRTMFVLDAPLSLLWRQL